MSGLVFGSLRVRIMAIVVVALLPLFVVMVYGASVEQQRAIERAQKRLMRFAAWAALDHKHFIAEAQQLLTGLALVPAVRALDGAACSAQVARIDADNDAYQWLGATTPDGRVFCSSRPMPHAVSLSDRVHFREAVRTRGFVIGDYTVGRISHEPVLPAGYPVIDDAGRIRAVLVIALDFRRRADVLAQARPADSTLTIVDRNGTILDRRPAGVDLIGKRLPDAPLVRAVLGQRRGFTEMRGLDGVARVYAFAPLYGHTGTVDAFVILGVPRQEIVAPIRSALLLNLVAAVGATLLALALAVVLADAFVRRPAKRLIAATKEIAEGRFETRTAIDSSGEIGALARAFDRMAETLETKHTQMLAVTEGLRQTSETLERTNRALRVLGQSNSVLVRARDESHLLQSICRTIVDAGGYRLAWVGLTTDEDPKTIRPVAHAGDDEGYLDLVAATWSADAPVLEAVGALLHDGEPRVIRDLATSRVLSMRRAEAVQRGFASLVALRLFAGDRALGVLVVYAAEVDAFSAEEVALLVELADDLAYGMVALRMQGEYARAQKEVERQRAAAHQSEKLAAMGQLLAGVAHELNNPLAVVLGRVEMLMKAAAGGPLQQPLEKISTAAQRCSRIVRNFLALARQYPPERHDVDFNQTVREAMEIVAYPLRVDGVEVTLDLADGLPRLWADPHRLHQVVVNLVSNARDAMRAVPVRRLAITTRCRTTRDCISLKVVDSGPGIPEDLEKRIFEPFFTTKPPGEGTGLGLSLCHGILEDHGGSIRVEHPPGGGAAFVVELPVLRNPSVGPAAVSDTPAPAAQASTILIVDDEGDVAELLAEMLASQGHRVETAANGRIALEKVRTHRYDLVLTDLRMPEIDGPALYRHIERQDPALARRIVFITGDVLTGETKAFLAAAGAPTIEKPFTEEAVSAAVSRALR